LTIGVDTSGNRVWSRQDSFHGEEEEVAASAGEYVVTTSEGGSVIITDEEMGLGFMFIDQYSGSRCEKEIYYDHETILHDHSRLVSCLENHCCNFIHFSTCGLNVLNIIGYIEIFFKTNKINNSKVNN